jgi:hypothetical protein
MTATAEAPADLDTVRFVRASELEKLARMALKTLDAQQVYFKNRSTAQARQLLAEAKDHEARLKRTAMDAVESATGRRFSLFDEVR